MFSEWLQSQGWLFWLVLAAAPIYVAWFFYMVWYNIGYARSRGNFHANVMNERDFHALEAKNQREGKTLHSPECQHHPENRKDGPPAFMP
jgi:hypothetical protein